MTKVLFVCLGNICRSPTAEAVFKKVVKDAGRSDEFAIDSCGTGGGSTSWYEEDGFSYHEGDAADPRMTAAALPRGIHLESRSRPLTREDLISFDYIIAMETKNVNEIIKAATHWSKGSDVDYVATARAKTHLALDFSLDESRRGCPVPDPYYGGPSGFSRVLDLLDDACHGLMQHCGGRE